MDGRTVTGSLGAERDTALVHLQLAPASHVVWYMMPTTPNPASGRELTGPSAVERADANHVTYWITVTNMTNANITFEGRYAVLG